jgi:hypothetical protein
MFVSILVLGCLACWRVYLLWGYTNNLPLVFLQVYLSSGNDIPVALVPLQGTKTDNPYGQLSQMRFFQMDFCV